MAKKNENASMYVNTKEEIRKAKGNPNKNVHAKKNGSNYGGYSAENAAEKITNAPKSSSRLNLPKSWKTALIADLIVIMALIIMRATPLKDNLVLGYITTLVLGLSCGGFFCYRKIYRKAADRDMWFNVIQVVLFLVAAFYIFMSIMGFLNLLGLIQ